MTLIEDSITFAAGTILAAAQMYIPALILTMGFLFLFNYVQKRSRWKWFGATLLTILIGVSAILFLTHAFFIFSGWAETNIEQIPPDIRALPQFQQSQENVFFLLIQALINAILAGIVITGVLFPFALGGNIVFESLKKRFKGMWTRFGITVGIGVLVFTLLLAAFPWIPVSFLFLAFFGL